MSRESQHIFRFSGLMALVLSAFVAVPSYAAKPVSDVPTVKKQPVEKQDKAPKAKGKGAADDKDEDKAKFDPNLPAIPLTSALMYQILHAEFVGRAGDTETAYSELIKLANQTKDPRFAKRAAELAVKERDVSRSLAAVRLWSQLAPKSEETEKYLMNFLLLDNRADEIAGIFQKRLAAAPADQRPLLIYQAQQTMVDLSDRQVAFDTLEKVVAPYQDLSDAHIALAVSAMQNKDVARATAEADQALALKPDSEMAVLTKAQVVGRADRALEILSDFLAKHPDAQEVRIAYARLAVSEKQYEPAQHAFEEVLKRSPDERMALYSLGLLTMQQGKPEQAEGYFRKWLKTGEADLKKKDHPDDETVQVWFLLSQVAEDRHHYDESLGWLEKIPADGEDEVVMVREVRRAQLYAKKSNIAKTRQILSGLRQRFLDEAERLLLTEAQILREVKQYKEAYALLNAERPKFAQSVNVLYDFALTAEFVGQYDEMEKVLKQIVVLDPNYQHAWNALGYSLAEQGIRLTEAQGYIEKAMELAPDDAYITDSLGWVFFKQGRLDEAERELRKAYALRGDDEIAIHLGEVLWQKGERENALLLFRQVQQKDAVNESLKKTVKRLNIKL